MISFCPNWTKEQCMGIDTATLRYQLNIDEAKYIIDRLVIYSLHMKKTFMIFCAIQKKISANLSTATALMAYPLEFKPYLCIMISTSEI